MSKHLNNVINVLNMIEEKGHLCTLKEYEMFLEKVIKEHPSARNELTLPLDTSDELKELGDTFSSLIPDTISEILDLFRGQNITKETIDEMSSVLDIGIPNGIYSIQIGGMVKQIFAIFRNFLEESTKRNIKHQTLYYRHQETKGIPTFIGQIKGYIKCREMELQEKLIV